MNIAPGHVDASAPPFSHHSGDLMDRMHGSLPSNSAPSIDLKQNANKPGEISSKLAPGLSLEKGGSDPKKFFPTSLKQAVDAQKPDTEHADGAAEAKEDATETAGAAGKPEVKKRRSRKKWKKPKDKPNRPLSAYNLFFQTQRVAMLGDSASSEVDKTRKRVHRRTHGKIGFAEMARVIGTKWKTLPDEERKPFEEQAAKEKKRYATELETWKQEQKRKAQASKKSAKAQEKAAEMNGSSSLPGGESASADSMRLQMMANNGKNAGQQRLPQDSTGNAEYLRALQERQAQRAALLGRSNVDPSIFQYPSAAEASANAILQQFQGMQNPGMQGSMQSNQPMQQQAQVQAQAQLLELQKQQFELQQKQARLLELQQQMNSSQGGLDTNNLQQLRFQAAMQPMGGIQGMGGDLQQGFGTQQPPRQFGPGGASGDMERMNQMPQYPPQFTGNMAAAMMRLQRRYGM
mmetsp:Transcript_107106/g.160132  ORF Transcript_107106/g.160132 Transcript_107106/m.160132 type:complete len:462 (+) Transcript_107106:104-1489(+)|eukprot:CAMPEP_0117047032 /NCGR_PEP_ID=MMETSP0472-20121206/32513_1 /TAXON_ID=693140 ORGANISM="Tiarina fusus, Strain LIS" /NCGR_SAMPLE_ID=MMETSP0472 /ASSEMBLY_ACC=CAM_ASM_000603 /LENGTH=461 /DNA_ID=CAMNT_0004759597 /DNA_START=104 /DNA_END=1489 /DNA_ORIENTATION=+